MGEVWKARDTRLGREVAVKVLPAKVASDPSRLKRLEKEARSASALNHPNIVTIYDIGSCDSVWYIAMELVAGKTLRETLFSGPLAMRRLLAVAAQIADGLARAHEAGIVHRDLKPENIMVTKDGLVKILDFGLAKLTTPWSEHDGASPPQTETGTSAGAVLGTAGYMSPEQAGGLPVDFRSDQFSFGSILYEMATAERAFQKGMAVDTLSAICHEDPKPVAESNPETPAPLRWIVERCLAKDPEGRYASTRDLAREVATLRDHLSEATTLPVSASAARIRSHPAPFWGLAAAAAAALVIAAVSLLRSRPPTAQIHAIRFSISTPSDAEFSYYPQTQSLAFSPDGSQLAFIAASQESLPGGTDTRIWLRPLSALEARAMPGTEGAWSLFWSPDGRSIGFFAAGKLWRIDVSGGAPVPLCDEQAPAWSYAGTWGADGQILFSSARGGGSIASLPPEENQPPS